MTAGALLKLIVLTIGFLRLLAQIGQQKRLLDAGAAEAILKGARESDDAIKKANAARELVRTSLERSPDGLRDNDGYKRD